MEINEMSKFAIVDLNRVKLVKKLNIKTEQ